MPLSLIYRCTLHFILFLDIYLKTDQEKILKGVTDVKFSIFEILIITYLKAKRNIQT
jgi:hypothetical protein